MSTHEISASQVSIQNLKFPTSLSDPLVFLHLLLYYSMFHTHREWAGISTYTRIPR